ncbi:HNH endonuclease [Persephonella sp.]
MGQIVRFGDEVIKQIDDFPSYGVSNLGYVYRNFDKGLLPDSYRSFRLRTYINRRGYHLVQLSRNGKRKVFYLHRLVAQYFVPNPGGYRYVVHKDGNKSNNTADNLQWSPSPAKLNRMKSPDKKDILTVSIPAELKIKLYKKALEEGTTVSGFIEKLLQEVLD